ncbi:MAG: hypothetical protein Q8880_11165 [Bacteroidota bacterium]|nr:hypothetical protein [Bacteroidota bacterium]
MKKRVLLFIVSIMLMFSFATGVFAATKITAIKAFLNSGVSIQINGKKFQPSGLSPIVYNGKTYVPIINYTQALGSKISFNNSGDGTYTITTASNSDEGKPTNDAVTTPSAPAKTTAPAAPSTSAKATKATGSLTSPIPLGEKFTFTSTFKDSYQPQSYSGTYSCTVKTAKPITRDQIAALGFSKPKEDAKTDYVLVDLVWEAKNCKLISVEKSYDLQTKALNTFGPSIWGTETPSDNYIVGGTDYGFDGSLSTNIDKVTNYKELSVGQTGSFTAEGKVILSVYKNEVNYLVIKDEGQKDYDKSLIHFKLK